jgi:hypothetical protein
VAADRQIGLFLGLFVGCLLLLVQQGTIMFVPDTLLTVF